jgi:hypothetical protein
VTRPIICEDCGKSLARGDYRPLDLMRPDPDATSWVWNATIGKHVHRPARARPGGRRFRVVDLCRRCAADALRKRAGHTVKENGAKRYIRSRERIPPKRGGRPRLLTDDQLRSLHLVYVRDGLSIHSLADALLEAGKTGGTRGGLHQSILYGWRRLGLPVRTRHDAMVLAHQHRRPAA